MLLTPLLSLALGAAQPVEPAIAGYYEAHQMEMAGALELAPGGRFRYAFDYGAVSEGAAGSWSVHDGTLHLTSSRSAVTIDPERTSAILDDQQLAISGDTLLLERYDMVIRFKRVKP